MAVAQRLGSEGRERIVARMLLGTALLVAVRIEADYIAGAWGSLRQQGATPRNPPCLSILTKK
jgi:hypothetical protein